MKIEELAILGVLAYALLKNQPTSDTGGTYTRPPDPWSPEEIAKRWQAPQYTPPPESYVYENWQTVTIPIQALASKDFSVYSVDKGGYTEYYYTM